MFLFYHAPLYRIIIKTEYIGWRSLKLRYYVGNRILVVYIIMSAMVAYLGYATFCCAKGGENQAEQICNDSTRMAEADAARDVQLYALSAALIDGVTGDVIYAKDAEEHRANASTTKILTCILALECGNADDEVRVSSYAAKMPEVRLGVREGETYTLRDMLYAMMLESYNDAAVVIAEHIAGDVTAFADMMNAKAAELGCSSTYFITPNGLDAEDDRGFHGTSALDLARIMRYCVVSSPKSEEFKAITGTPAYSFTDISGSRGFSCTNHNALLNMMDGAVSGKTGFTCDAGYCYVGAVERNGHMYIFSLLGCGWPNNKSYKWKDSRTLVAFAEENTVYETVTAEGLQAVTVTLSSDLADSVIVNTHCDMSLEAASAGSRLSVEYVIPETISAPVTDGSVVGSANVYRDGELFDIYPVTITESVDDITAEDEISKMLKSLLLWW